MAIIIYMYDDVNLELIPQDAKYVAAYASGRFQNLGEARTRFPHATVLSIATNAGVEADALDVEAGDATIAQAPAWVAWQASRGIYLPVVYCSVSNADALVAEMAAKGISRDAYRVWSAHYDSSLGAHLCGPDTCKLCKTACDWTQYTNRANGSSLDESVLSDEPVFTKPVSKPVSGTPKPEPAPAPVKAPTPAVTAAQAAADLAQLEEFVKDHS
jgi:hypothetical protein